MSEMTRPAIAGVLLAAATVLSANAGATTYVVQSATSTMSDVRHFGGALIPEILDYAPHGGELDQAIIANWPLMHVTQGTWDPADPTTPPVRGGHNIGVAGFVTIVDGEVTEAELSQLDTLSYGTFQSYNFVDDFGTVTDLVTNGLVWNWIPETGHLVHQANPDLAVCTPAAGGNFGGASGTAVSGQCGSLLRAAVNNSTGNSLWNWDGVPGESYVIRDQQNAPYHSGTGLTLDVGGHAAVTWDLDDFVAGQGGIVRARVTNAMFASENNNATVVAATYTLNLVLVEASDDAFEVDANSVDNALDVLANDVGFSSPVTVTISSDPDSGGSASFNEGSGTISYTPALNFSGEERFSYTVSGSGIGETAEAEVTVTVLEPRRSGSSAADPWMLILLGALVPLLRRPRRR